MSFLKHRSVLAALSICLIVLLARSPVAAQSLKQLRPHGSYFCGSFAKNKKYLVVRRNDSFHLSNREQTLLRISRTRVAARTALSALQAHQLKLLRFLAEGTHFGPKEAVRAEAAYRAGQKLVHGQAIDSLTSYAPEIQLEKLHSVSISTRHFITTLDQDFAVVSNFQDYCRGGELLLDSKPIVIRVSPEEVHIGEIVYTFAPFEKIRSQCFATKENENVATFGFSTFRKNPCLTVGLDCSAAIPNDSLGYYSESAWLTWSTPVDEISIAHYLDEISQHFSGGVQACKQN